jgi:hypothetical protein
MSPEVAVSVPDGWRQRTHHPVTSLRAPPSSSRRTSWPLPNSEMGRIASTTHRSRCCLDSPDSSKGGQVARKTIRVSDQLGEDPRRQRRDRADHVQRRSQGSPRTRSDRRRGQSARRARRCATRSATAS